MMLLRWNDTLTRIFNPKKRTCSAEKIVIFKLNFVSCPDVDLLEAPREHIFLVGARAVQGYAAGCIEIVW